MTNTTRFSAVRHLAPLIAAVAAGAVALAPAAGATSNPAGCRESGAARVCQKQGHASLHVKPTPRSPMGSLFSSPWLPGYGKGMLPPLIALD